MGSHWIKYKQQIQKSKKTLTSATKRSCKVKKNQSHRISDESLVAAALVWFLLAADVVKSEQQVVPLRQTGRESQFHFFVEVRRPERRDQKGIKRRKQS